jgi:hypothetical protein
VISAFTRVALRLVGELTTFGIATMLFVLLLVGYAWACAISVALHVPLAVPAIFIALFVSGCFERPSESVDRCDSRRREIDLSNCVSARQRTSPSRFKRRGHVDEYPQIDGEA